MENATPNSKQMLEEEKLKLDIIELKKPWYAKSNYLQVLLPTTVAIGSLFYAIVSGLFSTKYDQLQLQKEQLKLEALYFQEKKDSIVAQTTALLKKNSDLTGLIQELNLQNIRTKNDLLRNGLDLSKSRIAMMKVLREKSLYNVKIDSLINESVNRKKQLETDIMFLNKEKQSLMKNVQASKRDIYDFSYSQKILTDSIKYLNQDINDLKKQIEIFKSANKGLKTDFLDKREREKSIDKYVDKNRLRMMAAQNRHRKRTDTMTAKQLKEEVQEYYKKQKEEDEKIMTPALRNKPKEAGNQ